jgi:hypothetical protein
VVEVVGAGDREAWRRRIASLAGPDDGGPPPGADPSTAGGARAGAGGARPRVSICLPTFNGADYFRESLESACSQTWEDLEILVVDDGSMDGTLAIADAYARRDRRVSVHRNDRRLGLAGNWNRCVALAQGQWVKFLFQDDVLDPRCVERMLAAARPGVSLVVCRRRGRVEPGTPAEVAQDWVRHVAEYNPARCFAGAAVIDAQTFAEQLLRQPAANCVGEPTATLIQRQAFARFGGFHPFLRHLVDWEHAARIALHTGCCYVDEPLATFRIHGGSATSRSRAEQRFRMDVIDPLVVLYEHAAAPVYEPLRCLAARREPSVDLAWRLRGAVEEARRLLALTSPRSAAGRRAHADWGEAVQRYPWLEPP